MKQNRAAVVVRFCGFCAENCMRFSTFSIIRLKFVQIAQKQGLEFLQRKCPFLRNVNKKSTIRAEYRVIIRTVRNETFIT